MRRMLYGLVIAASLLSACSDPEVTSFSEVHQVPGDVWELVDPGLSLQLLSSEDMAYIVFQSEQAVTADYKIDDDMVVIKLDETGEAEEEETHVFKLMTNAKQDKIDVLVNGKSRPFDQVAAF